MPRIHGQNQHRSSSHSRRAGSTTSTSGVKQRSHSGATTINIGSKMDIDDFEDDFSYDELSGPKKERSSFASHSKQQHRRTKQHKFTLEDTSSEEEDEEELPEPCYQSTSSKASTTKKNLTSKKKKATKVSIDPKRLTPTVSSPKITLSSIAKNKRTSQKNNNMNASSKRGPSKKEPIGKPIKSMSRGKKSGNDENYDNDAEQLDEGRQSARRSRRKKGAAATDNVPSAKKQQNVSFASNTKTNGEDMRENGNTLVNGEDCINEGRDITPDSTSINRDHSTQIVLPLRAIAIDNRIVPTFTADFSSQKSFFEQMPTFLEGMLQKGVLQPQQLSRRNNDSHVEGTSIIASLVHGTSSSQINGKGIGARVEQSVVPRASFLLEETSGDRVANSDTNEWLSKFLTPINHGLESADGNDDIDVEPGFSAQDSWKYFGDLVEAIEYKLSNASVNSQQNSRPNHPCAITLFTTDTTFFAESDPVSHTKGLETFWKRISPAFQSSVIAAVSIVIVGTKYDDVNLDLTQVSSDDFRRSIQCINEIRSQINELSQSMSSSSEWVFSEWNGKPLVDLQLEYIEGKSISFQKLQQKYVQGSFYETYPNAHGRLSFDLPETIDGIMCSISLDLQYSTLPHSIDSNETLSLVTDMKRISALSSSNVEVIQSIPLSNVDSAMIYGVPMTARAGIDDDMSRYNEMKMLVRQMWKYLSSNDIGLILRVRFEGADSVDGARLSSREELFLLVCEQAVEKPCVPNNESGYDRSEALGVTVATKHKSSCHGMLFRYASKGQMLRFLNEDELEQDQDETSAEEMQYQDYIERSIEMLATTGLNPLLL